MSKLTTGSFFGGLFKRAVQNVHLSDNAPDEMKQLLKDVQDALKPEDTSPPETEQVTVEVVGEKVEQ